MAITLVCLLGSLPASAQGVVDFNVNVTGTCAPSYDVDVDGVVRTVEFECGQIGRQQNEPSCKSNPLNELNKLCAYNDYSLSDLPDKQGDTVIGYSESRDGKFIRRLLTGTRQNFWNGQDFMADPTMLVSEGFAAVTSISGIRGGNSVMQIQRMIELNTETGFRFFSEAGQIEIAKISGSNFIDKPDARLIYHPDGGTETVTMTLEDGRTVTRELKRIRIVVTFAVFNGSEQNIRTYTTYNDCFGAADCWSNARQISQTSGLDQGLSVANIGSKFLYVMRRFAEGTEADVIVGSVDNRAGTGNPGKVFEIGDEPEICAFDQVTLPDPLSGRNAVSFRTNDFPWVSATANEFVLVYAERPRDALGNCLDEGSRVMVRTSQNGTKWSDPVEVSPVAGHAFQFMQSIACNDEFCQVLWYDTRNESLVFDALIGAGADQKHWEKNPYIEDFDVNDPNLGLLRFRRTADVFTTRIDIAGNGSPVPTQQPERVSRYVVDNQGVEREVNLMNVQAFGGNTVAFNGDYISINDLGNGNFFAAWTDWRRARPQRGSDPFDVPAPYAIPEGTLMTAEPEMTPAEDTGLVSAPMPASPGEPFPMPAGGQVAETSGEDDEAEAKELVARTQVTTDRYLSAFMPRAEGLEDPNPFPATCRPTGDPKYQPQFDARAKDSEIYGADIDDRVRLVSPTPAKNYCTVVDPSTGNCIAGGLIQRTFVLGLNNDVDEDRPFTLVIANQPGNPVQVGMGGDDAILVDARASWRQLPFGPTFDPSGDPPDVVETRTIPGLSADYVTLFVVSQSLDAPVTVLAYDDNGDLVAELTVNGISAAGDLVDPGVVADVRLEEVHNPELIQPDWANLAINPLNPAYRNPAYRNPAYRNPAYRNPAYRNEAFTDSSYTDPTTNTSYDYEQDLDATELLNPALRNPAYRNEAPDSFVDVTFGIEGDTNTISAFNADLAFAGPELNQFPTQLIAWNTNNVDTLQDCDPGQITEDTVIAAVNNPDFTQLKVATIENNLDGSITFPAPVQGITNVTLRIFADFETLDGLIKVPDGCDPSSQECSVLQKKLGWVIAAQAGNTTDCNDPNSIGNCQIIKDKTLVIKDVIPPSFEPPLEDGSTFVSEATGSNPTMAAEIDLVTTVPIQAFDNGEEVGVTCYINDAVIEIPGGESEIGQAPMPVWVPIGESTAQCDTDPDSQGNVGTWTGFVVVEDNGAPEITIPGGEGAELIVPPSDMNGAIVNYLGEGNFNGGTITVSDNIFAEGYPYPALSCEPASGTQFALGSTTVNCTATDAGPCSPTGVGACQEDVNSPNGSWNVTTASFTVTVQDLAAPTFTDAVDGYLPDVGPVEATAVDTPVVLTPPRLDDDIDDSPTATFSPAQPGNDPPVFPLGTTEISWTAKDFTGNESTALQRVIVQDTKDPIVSVSFPGGSPQNTDSLSGKAVTFDVDVDDIFPDASSIACESAGESISSGDFFPVGDTTVTCTAGDTSGNTGSGSATVTVVFQYRSSGISGKSSGKTGSSFPLAWNWTDSSGTPLTVSEQILSIEPGACPASGEDSQTPGNSGLRQDTDGSYLYNLQAVDPDTGEDLFAERPSTPYCFTVSLPTGEFQDLTIDVRP